EGAQRRAVAAAHEDEPLHAIAMAAVHLEADLHAHRVAGDDRAFAVADGGVEDGREIVGEIGDVDAPRAARHRRAAVAAIMPMHDAMRAAQRRLEVLPDVAVAADAVAEDHGRRMGRSADAIKDGSIVAADGEALAVDQRVTLAAVATHGLARG